MNGIKGLQCALRQVIHGVFKYLITIQLIPHKTRSY
jgi:hypothetical protein